MQEAIAAEKLRLVDAGLILQRAGLGDMTRGHVSARLPGQTELFLMKPHGVGLDEITPENILTIDLDGHVVEGQSPRHSEVFIHSEIYRARDDVMSVIHVHPPCATALSATGRPIRSLSQGGTIFAGHLPFFQDTTDLIRTPDQGRRLAMALGADDAVLMRAHGVAVAAVSVASAVVLCLALEEVARVQLMAETSGADCAEFPAGEVARLRRNLLRQKQVEINFNYLARQARRGIALRAGQNLRY